MEKTIAQAWRFRLKSAAAHILYVHAHKLILHTDCCEATTKDPLTPTLTRPPNILKAGNSFGQMELYGGPTNYWAHIRMYRATSVPAVFMFDCTIAGIGYGLDRGRHLGALGGHDDNECV